MREIYQIVLTRPSTIIMPVYGKYGSREGEQEVTLFY